MSEFAMLRSRLLSRPGNFSITELKDLLAYWGYYEKRFEHALGSQIVFFNPESHHVIQLLRPGPDGFLRRYQLDQVVDELIQRGLLQ